VCLSATTTRTWRWNISGQVRLISRLWQTNAQTRQLIYRIWYKILYLKFYFILFTWFTLN
jgi:hypothetical protein